jgi:hypothetical protein
MKGLGSFRNAQQIEYHLQRFIQGMRGDARDRATIRQIKRGLRMYRAEGRAERQRHKRHLRNERAKMRRRA